MTPVQILLQPGGYKKIVIASPLVSAFCNEVRCILSFLTLYISFGFLSEFFFLTTTISDLPQPHIPALISVNRHYVLQCRLQGHSGVSTSLFTSSTTSARTETRWISEKLIIMFKSLPSIRACLFDMDGLLLDTEDKYTQCVNTLLAKYGRPPLPWSIKAQLQGRPFPQSQEIFHKWAQLPIAQEQYALEVAELQRELFPSSQPLPGVVELLSNLNSAKVSPVAILHRVPQLKNPSGPRKEREDSPRPRDLLTPREFQAQVRPPW